jgi:transposase
MSKKRTYQADRVERVDITALLPLLAAGCIVAIDAAKTKFVVALATLAGEVVKLFRFDHPVQTQEFVRVVEALRDGVPAANVTAAIEPTGTYSDAIRHQLVKARVAVVMVSPKRTHDSRELFDGVPSMHDPKSAMLVAKLCAMGLGRPWIEPPIARVRLRALVDLRRHEYERAQVSCNRLEAVMARHWPEFGRWMDVQTQKSAIALLSSMPSPARAVVDVDATRALVREASRGQVSPAIVDGLIAESMRTTGVPMVEEEEKHVRTLAAHVAAARRSAAELEREMKEIGQHDEVYARLAPWMGTYTTAVITTMCDPRQYANARQLEKACGLNLREKSSGEHRGQLHITKRGPGAVRHALYMFTLRMIESSAIVRAWYKRRRGYTEGTKRRAVVAVMRKLVRAMFHVAKGAEFDAAKLFDMRRLDVETTPTQVLSERITPRTTPRSNTRERRAAAAPSRASI